MSVPEVKEIWEGDVCEKCGCKEFERWYDEGTEETGDFNFMRCKKCGEVFIPHPQHPTQKYCSVQCFFKHKGYLNLKQYQISVEAKNTK